MSGYEQSSWPEYNLLDWDGYSIMEWEADIFRLDNSVNLKGGAAIVKSPGRTSAYTSRSYTSVPQLTLSRYKHKGYYDGDSAN